MAADEGQTPEADEAEVSAAPEPEDEEETEGDVVDEDDGVDDEDDEEDEDEKPAPKKKRKGKRQRPWLFWLGIVLVVLGAASVIIWQMRWYTPVTNRINAASVTFKVREDDKFALDGASISFRGTTYTTDASGQVSVVQSLAGKYDITVTKTGYTTTQQSITLKRGDNGTISISLKKEPEKLGAFQALITDYVSGTALADAQISVAGKTAKSDAAGSISLTGLAPGEYTLAASKTNFTTLERKVTVAVATTDITKVSLVPNGKVLFVSNRNGGKRALYTANYDGGNVQQFVAPLTDTEDFGPKQSPDGKFVVFSSTRDKITSAYDTSYLARLYIATSEGKNVKKLSDNVGATRVTWGASGRFFYYEAYKDNKQTEYIRSFYDTTKGTNLEIGEDANAVILNSKGTSAAYVTTPSTNGVYTSIITTLDLLSGARKVVQADIDSFASDKGFSFSADDTTLSYETQPAEGRKRFTINLSTGAQEAVALQTYDTRTYTISPDGTKKAFLETRDGKNDLFIVDAAGQNEKRVTTLGVLSPAAPVTWDATGRYLSFAVVKDGETALYIVSVGGGEVRKIVDFSADPQSIPYY